MSCPHIHLDGIGRCLFCGEMVNEFKIKKPSGFGESVNPFDLADALKKKAEQEKNQEVSQPSDISSKIPNIFDSDKVIFPKFENPLYLTAKMLLADAIYIINRKYSYPDHVCSNFAKEVLVFMTYKETRCGYVVLRFDDGEGHAIVAFETDYGLVYFEPQTGNQEYPQIGKHYRSQLEGIPERSLITEIEITWNC